ncbi:hypothetical protein [Xanthomonas vesicatoria]|uniref:Uncharacterized protein n=2 Tax=Xanthomonas vesicatoria TaxID=56460 RepID=A0AAJ0IXW8_9XANT|nr:hypothetical protein [Xanthomonas vesicatoria]APO93900.1 hypothetical protein BI313_04135 [Xanthomonas vesicatoria]APP74148.1 hypothetical protein BJD12_01440 [Xanthomonas vesicatoria ATCC 35937]EGD10112.1 hypothetical protein XVE_1594 [Xanthomonas vesicatoria ATCC 35937]KHM94318.1 hypothetical protein OR61_11910 [Xanthomonas vesicatoria]KHM95652.1 hypothetical protein OR60_07665 [Xanthomonas vesicatoria]
MRRRLRLEGNARALELEINSRLDIRDLPMTCVQHRSHRLMAVQSREVGTCLRPVYDEARRIFGERNELIFLTTPLLVCRILQP